MSNKYLICDLDGCLINTSWIWEVVRSQGVNQEDAFDIFNRLANAEKNQIELPLFKYLCFKASGGLKIHFMTARSEIIEVETINFISKKLGLVYGKDFTISSRPKDDFTKPAESKAKRLEAFIASGREVVLAIDDDEEILKMYEAKGISTLKWIIGFVPVQVVQEFSNQISNLINVKEVQCLN